MVVAQKLAPEVIWFKPSKQYLRNPADTLNAIHQYSAQKGLIGSYYGTDLDDARFGVWIMAWQSLPHHQKFMQEESYLDFILPVMDSMVGTGKINQIFLDHGQSLQKVLQAPITQFIYITVRPTHDRDNELEPLVVQLQQKLPHAAGCLSSCWGSSIENDHLEIGMVGWRSLADRNKAVNSPPLLPIIQRIRELSNVELRYASLRFRDYSELSPPL